MASLLALFAPWLTPAFSLFGSPVTWLEIFAFGVSLAMVWANMRVHPVAWPLAIVASLAYALVFADGLLLGEASLQIFFVLVSIWGWRQWVAGRGDGQALRVRRLAPRMRIAALVATLAAWPLLGLVLARASQTTLPFADALATVASVTGQILLARKLIETWPVWLMVNIFSVGLFAYKGLWLTALLYGLFAWLSVIGWRRWRALEGRPRA
jgi:nicotinamide mononucleotide transporter